MAAIGNEFMWMKTLRGFTLGIIKDLSHEQLLTIPTGFNNNILWQIGHLLYEQYQFFYGFTGQPLPLPEGGAEAYKALFDNGTSPKTWETPPDVAGILAEFASISDTIIADANAGKFDGFQGRELRPGLLLNDINHLAAFHCVHEGMHMGAIKAIKAFV